MSFRDLYNEVKDSVPGFPVFLAKRAINRTLREVYRARDWSHIRETGLIVIPSEVTTGTVSVTQNSTEVTASVAAKAEWDVLSPAITERQFRVGQGGPVYRILSYDSTTGVITLDTPYLGTTNGTASYSILRCLVSPPSTDFKSWVSAVDLTTQVPLNTTATSAEIDRFDPSRREYGTPLRLAAYKGRTDASGRPLYELHPYSTSALTLAVKYLRKGADLSADADTLPSGIPDELVIEGAKRYAFGWAAANAGRDSELKGVNWLNLQLAAQAMFKELLQGVAREDRATFTNFIEAEQEVRHSDEYRRTHAL